MKNQYKNYNHSINNILLGNGSKSKYKGKSPYGDADKDGVMNYIDCYPYNKNKQGILKKAIGNNPISSFLKKITGGTTTTTTTGPTATASVKETDYVGGSSKTVSTYTPSGGNTTTTVSTRTPGGGGSSVTTITPPITSGPTAQQMETTRANLATEASKLNAQFSKTVNRNSPLVYAGFISKQDKLNQKIDAYNKNVEIQNKVISGNGQVGYNTNVERRGIFSEVFFPTEEESRNLWGEPTPTQIKVKEISKKFTNTDFYKNWISSEGIRKIAQDKGSDLIVLEADISSAGRFKKLKQIYEPSLGDNKFSNLGKELNAQEKAREIITELSGKPTKEQLKILSEIRNKLNTKEAIKNFDIFTKKLVNEGIINPVNVEITSKGTIVTAPRLRGIETGAFIVDLKSGNKNIPTSTKVKPYTYPLYNVPDTKNSFSNLMGVGTNLVLPNVKIKEKQRNNQLVNSFSNTMLGLGELQLPLQKPRLAEVPYQPQPQTPYQPYPRIPEYKFPPQPIPFGFPLRLPRGARSYTPRYQPRTRKTKRKTAYAPSVGSILLGIKASKKFKGETFGGLGLRPVLYNDTPVMNKKYVSKLNKLINPYGF